MTPEHAFWFLIGCLVAGFVVPLGLPHVWAALG
jgi:hypothetical protein